MSQAAKSVGRISSQAAEKTLALLTDLQAGLKWQV